MENYVSILISVFFGAAIFIVPLIFTILNLMSLTKKSGKVYEQRKKYAGLSLVYGFVLAVSGTWYISSYKWSEPVVLGAAHSCLHQPFSENYVWGILITVVFAVSSLILLDREKIMPPLSASICVSGAYAGLILFLFCAIQLISIIGPRSDSRAFTWDADIIIFYLFIYIINYCLCTARIISETIKKYSDHFKESQTVSRFKFSEKLKKILMRTSGWVVFPVICLIPLMGLIAVLYILGGQGADGIIKAFTETSDWTFSKMVSPPPIQYEGHYLCTVAVNGHEKIVKPTRMGIRHNEKIVVNRQLCTANAFEQLIEDKTPRFHKLVRHIYDTYGYPISKYITTSIRADIVYFIMKPLEWIFIIALYLFDENPESRIALQYTGRHIREFSTPKKPN